MNKTFVAVLIVGIFIIAGGIALKVGLLPTGGDRTQVASISATPYTFTRTLKQGDQGNDVRQLQGYLIAWKYLSREKNFSYYGSPTQDAVKKFQSDNGLDRTGNIDTPTLQVLNKRILELYSTKDNGLGNTPTPYSNLNITAEPSTLTQGQSSTLTWSATNSYYCAISDQSLKSAAGTGITPPPPVLAPPSPTTPPPRPLGGTQIVTPQITTTYTLSCVVSTGDTLTESVTVTVSPAQPIPPINGTCGTANNQTFHTAPTTNLCATGNATPVSGNGPWTWSCLGSNGGSNASCRANIAIPPPTLSASINPTVITKGQSATLTWSGTNLATCKRDGITVATSGSQIVTPAVSTTYTVSCVGTDNTTITKKASITVTEVAVNGSCGTAHNQTFPSAPTANLCAVGVASPVPVSGNGPWTWSCLGSNGGTNASCRANATSSIVYSAPITISKGGTYTGNWESNDPAIPAVNIVTSAPVIIENCNIRSKGHHISSLLQETNVTVRNCTGYGVNPNKLNARMGRFINLWKPNSLVAERNTMDHTAGIYIASAGSSTSKISIRFNKAKNLDGRLSDGANGYLSSFFPAQFVQFNFVQSAKNVEVAWNEIINEPWNSRPEDNINLYDTSGTADSPILIHDNYIQGAYPVNPLTDPYSGGGIIVEGPSNTMSSASGYIQIYNNQVISASNHGISVDGGHDSVVRDNTVISSGLLPDGSRIYSANVGLVLWDYYNSINKGTFYNNHIINNTVGWIRRSGDRNDWWFPHCNVAQNTCNGNVKLPSPITLDTEKLQYQVWLDKLGKNSIAIGSN